MKSVFIALVAKAAILSLTLTTSLKLASSEAPQLQFTGVVIQIGPQMPSSGIIESYRLAKYRVVSVTRGHYEKPTIVVDHFMGYGNELDSIAVGDTVCILANETTRGARYNVDGMRSPDEVVKMHYVSIGKPKKGKCK